MYTRCVLVVAVVASLVFPTHSSELLKAVTPNAAILQQFINLVQTHQMNVSIVTSSKQYWSNGELQDVKDSALLLPPNKILLTQSTLTEQVGKQWISSMKSLTGNGQAIASYRIATIQNGNILHTVLGSSDEESIPVSPSYESIIGIQHGIKGLVMDLPDWQIMYNFDVIGGENVQVIGANLNVTVIKHSSSMPETEITFIETLLPKMWMMFDDNTLMSKILVEQIDLKFPQYSWNVLVGAEEVSLDVVKYVTLTVATEYITIYAMPL